MKSQVNQLPKKSDVLDSNVSMYCMQMPEVAKIIGYYVDIQIYSLLKSKLSGATKFLVNP